VTRDELVKVRSAMALKDSIPRAMVRIGVLAEITVPGRTSGLPRTAVINKAAAPGGCWYVASGKASHQWCRNLQAAGRCRLRVGGRVADYVARELSGEEYAEAVRRLAPPFGKERFAITGPAFHLTPAMDVPSAA
jgi:deazaflavin-dependent oxidoreductase (nitroreductase family)